MSNLCQEHFSSKIFTLLEIICFIYLSFLLLCKEQFSFFLIHSDVFNLLFWLSKAVFFSYDIHIFYFNLLHFSLSIEYRILLVMGKFIGIVLFQTKSRHNRKKTGTTKKNAHENRCSFVQFLFRSYWINAYVSSLNAANTAIALVNQTAGIVYCRAEKISINWNNKKWPKFIWYSFARRFLLTESMEKLMLTFNSRKITFNRLHYQMFRR